MKMCYAISAVRRGHTIQYTVNYLDFFFIIIVN